MGASLTRSIFHIKVIHTLDIFCIALNNYYSRGLVLYLLEKKSVSANYVMAPHKRYFQNNI